MTFIEIYLDILLLLLLKRQYKYLFAEKVFIVTGTSVSMKQNSSHQFVSFSLSCSLCFLYSQLAR